jgi:enoyl-CoA hydratase/carnithine racemase
MKGGAEMDFATILYQKGSGVAKITLNRPEQKNSINHQTLLDLEAALEDFEGDDALRAAVLTGAGDNFCSGADLKYISSSTPEQLARFIRKFHQVINRIETLDKPVVAAIKGKCLAGGLEVALGCDILIAEEGAQLSDHHLNIGAIPGGGGEQRLLRIVGVKKALELVLTGKWLTAEEAERIGLVNQVAPAGKLEQTVEEMTKLLAVKSPAALKAAKYLINQGAQVDLKTGLEMEINAILQHTASSKDFQIGVDSFIRKDKQTY